MCLYTAQAQRRGRGSNWVDVQALARPAASVHHGEKEAHCAFNWGLPIHTQAVLLGESRSFLTGSGSPEFSDCAGGWNRHVHVVLPLPVIMGPLALPQSQGQEP